MFVPPVDLFSADSLKSIIPEINLLVQKVFLSGKEFAHFRRIGRE
jgi:hypothetical protein